MSKFRKISIVTVIAFLVAGLYLGVSSITSTNLSPSSIVNTPSNKENGDEQISFNSDRFVEKDGNTQNTQEQSFNEPEDAGDDDDVILLDEFSDQDLLTEDQEGSPDSASGIIHDSSRRRSGAVVNKAEKENDNSENFFSQDDLNQLASSGADVEKNGGKLIGGSIKRRSSVSQSQVTDPVEDDSNDQEDIEPELEYPLLFTGQARGYAMLYMMHPKARATVERELEILLESGLREIYLGVLIDGTFGQDFPYLATVLQRLANNDRIITLALYLTNGATMRKYDSTPIDAPFVKIEPVEFRNLIKTDRNVQNQFLALARKAKPTFDLNRNLNPENSNIAIVMLEDNLDRDSYQTMRGLAYSILGSSVEYIRNPCPGCYRGNDMESNGDNIELHKTANILQLKSGDGFTLDGQGFYFPWEDPGAEFLSLDGLLIAQNIALQRGLRYFGLWRETRQGLGDASIHPDRRHYEVPSEEQMKIEISILQDDLEIIAEEEEEFDEWYYY